MCPRGSTHPAAPRGRVDFPRAIPARGPGSVMNDPPAPEEVAARPRRGLSTRPGRGHDGRVDKAWTYLLVGLGSALGGMGRYWLAGVVAHHLGAAFPWGTLVVNVSGSFVIGLIASLVGPEGRIDPRWSQTMLPFFMAGLCGGYTTFSSFSLQTLDLMRSSHWTEAGLNVLLSVMLCLLAVFLGHWMGQAFNR